MTARPHGAARRDRQLRVRAGDATSTLQLPAHLCVIGTMNLIDQSLE
jgi:hypothetical protein